MPVTVYDYDSNSYVEKYIGMVMSVKHDYIQVMSDIWEPGYKVIAWDAETERPAIFSTGTDPVPVVDATPEVIEKYRAFTQAREYDALMEKAEEEAKRPVKGRTVKVVRGKSAVGTVGKVVVDIIREYRAGWRSNSEHKLGVALDDEMIEVPGPNGKVYNNHKNMVWVWARNVETLDPPAVDVEDLERRAQEYADRAVANL